MDAEPAGPPPRRDPEFESPLASPLSPPEIAPESYLRLVANPFLGFFAFVVWLLALRRVFGMGLPSELIGPLIPIIAAVFLAALWFVPALFQYHCLDCGRTGRLSRWREHVCLRSSMRLQQGRPRRFRGPTPRVQVILWLWLLLALGMAINALGWLD